MNRRSFVSFASKALAFFAGLLLPHRTRAAQPAWTPSTWSRRYDRLFLAQVTERTPEERMNSQKRFGWSLWCKCECKSHPPPLFFCCDYGEAGTFAEAARAAGDAHERMAESFAKLKHRAAR